MRFAGELLRHRARHVAAQGIPDRLSLLDDFLGVETEQHL
jgi:hypothetical protein